MAASCNLPFQPLTMGCLQPAKVLPQELQRSHLCAAAVQHGRNWNGTSTTALTVTSEVGSLIQSKAQCERDTVTKSSPHTKRLGFTQLPGPISIWDHLPPEPQGRMWFGSKNFSAYKLRQAHLLCVFRLPKAH